MARHSREQVDLGQGWELGSIHGGGMGQGWELGSIARVRFTQIPNLDPSPVRQNTLHNIAYSAFQEKVIPQPSPKPNPCYNCHNREILALNSNPTPIMALTLT